MKCVLLPNSTKRTSQLGFGCAFWASIREHDATRILDAAYDAGIRHFDVAPYYLNGAAEAYVGKFLSKYEDVSVATKYGLLPDSAYAFQIRLMRILLKPIARSMRGRKNSPLHAKISTISRGKAKFSPEEMQLSLKRSSVLLNRPYIDMFLFHEPDVHDLSDERLLHSVHENVAEGRIGAVGVGGQSDRAVEVFRNHSHFCDVMQYDWNAFSGNLLFPGTFQVIYWVTGRSFHEIYQMFLQDDDLVRRWSDVVGSDLHQPDNMRTLLFKAALLANSDGITLFYSSKVEHIYQNVAIAENGSLDESARKFLDLALATGLHPVRLTSTQG